MKEADKRGVESDTCAGDCGLHNRGLLAPGAASAGEYAPLDCAKAKSAAEKTICKSYALGQAEARGDAVRYRDVARCHGQRGDLRDAQREWLKTREACGASVPCLTDTYATRIRALADVIDGIASHGPF